MKKKIYIRHKVLRGEKAICDRDFEKIKIPEVPAASLPPERG